MDTTVLKTIGNSITDYTMASTRKVVELNTELFKGWVELNKSIVEMTPMKSVFAQFTPSKK
jgi:hypothetical protein